MVIYQVITCILRRIFNQCTFTAYTILFLIKIEKPLFFIEVDASFHWFGMRFYPSPRKCSTFFSQECLHFRKLWIFSITLQHESGSMLLKYTIKIFHKKKSINGELRLFIEICVQTCSVILFISNKCNLFPKLYLLQKYNKFRVYWYFTTV